MEGVWSVNPSTNAGRTDGRPYLGTPTQSASGHPYVDYAANLASNQGNILSQGTHLVGEGSWTFGIFPDINDVRINAQASSLIQLLLQYMYSLSLVTNTDVQAYFPGSYSSSPFALHPGIDNKAGTPHPDHLVTDIRDEDFPVTPSSDSMSLTSYSGFSLVCCLSICSSMLI